MKLKAVLTAYFAQWFTSPQRRQCKHRREEKKLQRAGTPLTGTCYLRADDPYCYLLSQVLEKFCLDTGLQLKPIVVRELPRQYYPEPEKLSQYALLDAKRLATRFRLQPPEHYRGEANLALCKAATNEKPWPAIAALYRSMWIAKESLPPSVAPSEEQALQQQLDENQRSMCRQGIYLTALINYAGEHYWGLDRLYHLEQRLTGSTHYALANENWLTGKRNSASGKTIDCYFSFRSPYSYIALPRLFALADFYGCTLNILPVLPMVMRGLAVPKNKRFYILLDAKREAEQWLIPFGKIADPVGKGVEHALAIYPLAEQKNKTREYLLSLCQAVWSEGIDIASMKGLKKVTARAGLDWRQCQQALADDGWREWSEKNRQALYDRGLWGVPSFHIDGNSAWGQDRLWWLEDYLNNPESA